MRLDATGASSCQTSITEQGQGSEAITAQIVATALGVPMERVRVILGDTDNTPYGGGTWASRGAGIGGEAAWQAGKALRQNILAAAATILQAEPEVLDIVDGDCRRRGITARDASPSTRWPASSISAPIRFRLAFRPR